MKAVLVIEMPTDCRRCQLMVDRFCYGIPVDEVHDNINVNERPKWCPLRRLPQKKQHEEEIDYEYGYIDGFNDCVDEIAGE